MTCRHGPYDPNCGSYKGNIETLKSDYEEQIRKKVASETPDAEKFEIEEIEEVGRFLVLKVKYPNCKKCEYEGSKVMVFCDVTIKDAIKWRRIDPHFRDPKKAKLKTEAPSPVCRFPANESGWLHALDYAKFNSPSSK
jgi:hypothetical protein